MIDYFHTKTSFCTNKCIQDKSYTGTATVTCLERIASEFKVSSKRVYVNCPRLINFKLN